MFPTIKNFCCIGAGYVGGPTMTVMASKCPDLNFHVVDINKERIKAWNNEDLSQLPIFEPGLKEIIASTRNINLFFSNNVKNAISTSDIIFISIVSLISVVASTLLLHNKKKVLYSKK